ncbi:MAG: type IV pilus assembly protein PilB [Candidatus Omnitrophota bacterium]|jgi:type IV pilus assembly protein PilB
MFEPDQSKLLAALKEAGLMDQSLDEAVAMSTNKHMPLGQALLNLDLINTNKLMECLAKAAEVPFFELSKPDIASQLNNKFPKKLALLYTALCIDSNGSTYLIMGDPMNIEALEDAKISLGIEIKPGMAAEEEIEAALKKVYPDEDEIDASMDSNEEDLGWQDNATFAHEEGGELAPIVQIVDLILMDSCNRGASDIHIEPFEKRIRIRYRVDGQLAEVLSIPIKQKGALLARIKIMANLDITESRIPQDGRFKMQIGEKEIDYRVSILPVYWGGKIVMRSLDKSNLKVGLADLNFSQNNLDRFKEALKRPFGMIIVTGPTGSGKSTTLYSILNELNTVERNIITVEDPIEYQVKGISQVQAKADIGMTFAAALRSILRQSPDVVMIGEIRDAETADIAVKASLTGQTVLSTLHTNDAAGAVVRLRDMGIESFLIASSLTLVAAQRLCRQICEHCKTPVEMSAEELLALGFDTTVAMLIDKPQYSKGRGCSRCGRTGYKGRVCITETLLVDAEMQDMINGNTSADEVKQYAMTRGMLTLRTDALLKFAQGIISVEEVLRVTTID